jgi:hypothetical protein
MVSPGYSVAGSGLEVRPNEIKQLITDPHSPMGGMAFSKFDSVMGKASEWIGALGPMADGLMGGNVTARAIANSTVSAFMGQGGSAPSMPGLGGMGSGAYGATPYTMKNLGSMPGPPPGYTGSSTSGMPGAPPGFGGTSGAGSLNPMGSTDISQFDSQINSMMSNNLMFLALQTKVQNVSQSAQMLSNLAKTDHETKLSAVRNIRSG